MALLLSPWSATRKRIVATEHISPVRFAAARSDHEIPSAMNARGSHFHAAASSHAISGVDMPSESITGRSMNRSVDVAALSAARQKEAERRNEAMVQEVLRWSTPPPPSLPPLHSSSEVHQTKVYPAATVNSIPPHATPQHSSYSTSFYARHSSFPSAQNTSGHDVSSARHQASPSPLGTMRSHDSPDAISSRSTCSIASSTSSSNKVGTTRCSGVTGGIVRNEIRQRRLAASSRRKTSSIEPLTQSASATDRLCRVPLARARTPPHPSVIESKILTSTNHSTTSVSGSRPSSARITRPNITGGTYVPPTKSNATEIPTATCVKRSNVVRMSPSARVAKTTAPGTGGASRSPLGNPRKFLASYSTPSAAQVASGPVVNSQSRLTRSTSAPHNSDAQASTSNGAFRRSLSTDARVVSSHRPYERCTNCRKITFISYPLDQWTEIGPCDACGRTGLHTLFQPKPHGADGTLSNAQTTSTTGSSLSLNTCPSRATAAQSSRSTAIAPNTRAARPSSATNRCNVNCKPFALATAVRAGRGRSATNTSLSRSTSATHTRSSSTTSAFCSTDRPKCSILRRTDSSNRGVEFSEYRKSVSLLLGGQLKSTHEESSVPRDVFALRLRQLAAANPHITDSTRPIPKHIPIFFPLCVLASCCDRPRMSLLDLSRRINIPIELMKGANPDVPSTTEPVPLCTAVHLPQLKTATTSSFPLSHYARKTGIPANILLRANLSCFSSIEDMVHPEHSVAIPDELLDPWVRLSDVARTTNVSLDELKSANGLSLNGDDNISVPGGLPGDLLIPSSMPLKIPPRLADGSMERYAALEDYAKYNLMSLQERRRLEEVSAAEAIEVLSWTMKETPTGGPNQRK